MPARRPSRSARSPALYDKDYVVSTYREHGHCLAKGAAPRAVMAELFGKATGISHGHGGSMHLFDPNLRFMGGYAIVGGGLPIAAGLGLSIAIQEEPEVVCCFFGDGALPQGAFHESLNLASLVEAAGHLHLREQLLRDGHDGAERHLPGGALPLRRALQDARRASRRHGRARGLRRGDRSGRARARRRRPVADRGGHLSLSRPFDVRPGGVSLQARGTHLAGARPDQEVCGGKLLSEHRLTEARLDEIERRVTAIIDDAVKFADESPEPALDTLASTSTSRKVRAQ